MDAPRGSVEFAETDELERLRRRAYGPDADIAGDVAAQARLYELEATQRRPLTPIVDAAAPVSARVSERVPVPEPVEAPHSASISVPQPVDEALAEHALAGASVTEPKPDGPLVDSAPTAAPWWRRHRWSVILGGAIAAIVLIAAGAWGSQLLANGSTPIPAETPDAKMPPVPAGFGPGYYLPAPDQVLALKSVGAAASLPDDPHRVVDALGISSDELRRYDDFEGLNVWSGEARYGMTCLLVAVPGQGPREGYSGEGCSPEGMKTIAELSHLGGDGFTRFVLQGDHVDVYVYKRAAGPSSWAG